MFVLFYLLAAAGGSVASFVFGSDLPSVGASGAVFGLFGVLLAASRTHHPVLDRQGRSLVGRIGMFIVINLLFGFSIPNVDNAAHIGGLLAGAWLGFLIVPGKVTTMRALWRPPAGTEEAPSTRARLAPILGVAALIAVLTAGVVIGSSMRRTDGVAAVPGQATADRIAGEVQASG
jgi:rhomboid protease GluP